MTPIGYAKPWMFQHLKGPTPNNQTPASADIFHPLLGFSRLQGFRVRSHQAGNSNTPRFSSLSASQSIPRDKQDSGLAALRSQVFSTSQQISWRCINLQVYSTLQTLLGSWPPKFYVKPIVSRCPRNLLLRCYLTFTTSFLM